MRLKDSELGTDLLHLGEPNDPTARERARQLFAQVLDCPGGLKIQTIHSFAQSLLAAFPAEAGIVPGFQPIEGRAEQELVRRTLAELMADAEASGDEWLIRDVQCLSRRLGEAGAVEYLQACARAAGRARRRWAPAKESSATILRADGPACGVRRRLYRAPLRRRRLRLRLAARRLPTRTASGARQTGLGHAEIIDDWLALTPIERAAALPELAQGRADREGHSARSLRGRRRPSRTTKPMRVGWQC